MPRVSVTFGVLLIIEGVGFYFGTGSKSVTALIPAMIGLPILLCGMLAFRDSFRKHAAHVAAVFGTLGLLAAVGRIASAGIRFNAAGASLAIMAALCGTFVALCVKSFVDVRRQRSRSDLP